MPANCEGRVMKNVFQFIMVFLLILPAVSGEWSEPVAVIEGGGPSLIQDKNGVYWLAHDNMVDNNEDIYLIYSRDLVEWSDPIRVTLDLEADYHPSLIQTTKGEYLVVFTSLRSGNYDIYISRSMDGLGWSEPIQLIFDEASDWYPNLYQDSEGRLILVFASSRSGSSGIYITASRDGVNWSEAKNVVEPGNDIYPLIVEAGDRFWLVFARHTGDYDDRSRANEHELFLTSSFDLDSWAKPLQLTSSLTGRFALYPAFIKTADGALRLSYTSNDLGNEEVYIMGSEDGFQWSSPERITKNVEYSESIGSTVRFKCDLKSMVDNGEGLVIAFECARTGSDIYITMGQPGLSGGGEGVSKQLVMGFLALAIALAAAIIYKKTR